MKVALHLCFCLKKAIFTVKMQIVYETKRDKNIFYRFLGSF
jgi:hypothetical protein